jgi:chromosome segregation ATPase
MASKRSRLDYFYDTRPSRPTRSQPNSGSPNDPLSFLVNVLKKRDGMVARAVKHKLRRSQNTASRPNSHPLASNVDHTSKIANLNAVIEQLRCSNKQLLDENSLLKNKCTQLEIDLKSANTLLNDSSSKCASVLNEHKILEDKSLVMESQIVSLKDDNAVLSHKVNTLSLQLSENSVKSSKLPQLKTEVNKLKNVNDVLKKTARKFETLYKDTSDKLDTCLLEKDALVKEMEDVEINAARDFNAMSNRFFKLRNHIMSTKDPPPDSLLDPF